METARLLDRGLLENEQRPWRRLGLCCADAAVAYLVEADAMTARLLVGDCRDVLATMDANSIDACVTDPPYGLEFMGESWDRLDWRDGGGMSKPGIGERQTAWPSFGGETANATCSLCGGRQRGANKCHCDEPDWYVRGEPMDKVGQAKRRSQSMQAWHEAWAREVYRVLKPGGHMLAFGGTRTHHRLMCAIEDAGFEIRDCLMFVYGSGFPKSLSVSKALDKARHDHPEWQEIGVWLRQQREQKGFKQKEAATLWPSVTGGLTGCVANWELGFNLPKWEQWLALKAFIGFGDEMDAEVWRLNGRKGKPGEAWSQREVVGEREVPIGHAFAGPTYGGDSSSVLYQDTTSATDLARQWDGWGTALKPAYEPIILARKPLSGSVAANVTAWGVGGLNIDGCRIGTDDDTGRKNLKGPYTSDRTWSTSVTPAQDSTGHGLGRWPANLILDAESATLLDELSGESRSPSQLVRQGGHHRHDVGLTGDTRQGFGVGYGDTGGASRYFFIAKPDSESRLFYTAKASRAERTQGGASGKHPTQKPIDLMQWLCRLICPPNGTILDPFAGSGTTGVAADREGLHSILIEQDAGYAEDARRKIIGDAPLFAEVVTP